MESEKTWYLIFCEEDNSFSKVHYKSVMNVESLSVGDIVTFFYGTKTHLGKVVVMSDTEEDIDRELQSRGKKARRVSRPSKDSEKDVLPKKRVQKPTKRFTPEIKDGKSKPKVSSKSKGSQSEDVAKKLDDSKVLEKQLEIESSDIDGDVGDGFANDVSDDSDAPLQCVAERRKSKKLKRKIESTFELESDQESSTENAKQSSIVKASPTKEQLKALLAIAEGKLAQQKKSSSVVHFNKSDEVGPDHPSDSNGSQKFNEGLSDSEEIKASSSSGVSMDSKAPSLIGVSAEEVNEEANSPEPVASFQHFDLTAEQLFGKHFKDEPMVLLKNNTYCKLRVVQYAINNVSAESHVCRRLLTGVFKEGALLNCTRTGQKPRAAGRDNAPNNLQGLHAGAIQDIIAYARDIGRRKGWKSQSSKFVEGQISQRIAEIKCEARKKKAGAQQ